MKLLLIIILCSLPSLMTAATLAAPTTINVSGEILPATCDINIDELNQSIDMGKYSVNDFPSTGSTTTPVKLSFHIQGCTDDINAAIFIFSGKSYNPSLFDLSDSSGRASDIALELLDANGNTISPGAQNRVRLKGQANLVTVFSMRLKSLKNQVTAADLSGTIYLDIEYE